MSWLYGLSALLSIALLIYLLIALFSPEDFS